MLLLSLADKAIWMGKIGGLVMGKVDKNGEKHGWEE
jgi:hypothetical protein